MARSSEFDVGQALDQAMDMICSKSYEATSMVDLMEAMDLNKGSL